MSSPPKARPLKPAKGEESSKTVTQRKRTTSGRVSAACEACKKRKTKCSGGPAPCQLCQSLGTECIIDLSLDMRRRAALQRTLDESKTYEDTLNGLLECISNIDQIQLDWLLDFIRTNPPRQDLLSAIQHHLSIARTRNTTQSRLMTDAFVDSPIDGNFEQIQLNSSQPDISGSSDDVFNPRSTYASSFDEPQTGKGKGTDQDDQRQLSLFLRRLKLMSDVDGASMLRRLLGSGSLNLAMRDFQNITGTEDFQMTDSEQPGSHNREEWHPGLQLRTNSDNLDIPEQSSGISNIEPSLQTGQNAGLSGIWSNDPRSGNDLTQPYSSRSSPKQIMGQRDKRMDWQSLSPSSTAATVPYIERVGMSSRGSMPNSNDLYVANGQPNERIRVPIHLVQPLIIPDTSYLSRLYTDFLQGAREMLANGVPLSEVFGNDNEMVVDLFFRKRLPTDKFDCSSWACELNRSFMEMDQFVRLANAYLQTQLMKWLFVPTLENYNQLPDMMKPTPSQLTIPHIGAIDLLPLPPIRDAAIDRLRDWVTALTKSNLSVNWPYGMDEALYRNSASGSTTLTTNFIEHICRYDNWSVDSSIFDTFPECRGKIRIHDS